MAITSGGCANSRFIFPEQFLNSNVWKHTMNMPQSKMFVLALLCNTNMEKNISFFKQKYVNKCLVHINRPPFCGKGVSAGNVWASNFPFFWLLYFVSLFKKLILNLRRSYKNYCMNIVKNQQITCMTKFGWPGRFFSLWM